MEVLSIDDVFFSMDEEIFDKIREIDFLNLKKDEKIESGLYKEQKNTQNPSNHTVIKCNNIPKRIFWKLPEWKSRYSTKKQELHKKEQSKKAI